MRWKTEKQRFKEQGEYSEWYTARQWSKSAGEHYSVALIDVEECCSALHVEEKAKRIQLVPEHRVCLRLCTVSRLRLSGWTAESCARRTHVYVRSAQGQARKPVGVIKRRAGFTRPLIAPSPFRLICLQMWVRRCERLYVGYVVTFRRWFRVLKEQRGQTVTPTLCFLQTNCSKLHDFLVND